MTRAASVLLGTSLALAVGVSALSIHSSSANPFSGPFGGSTTGSGLTIDGDLCLNGDCSTYLTALDGGVTLVGAPLYASEGFQDGTLAASNRDVFGNTFLAANRALDGGAGTYSFISQNDSCIKYGPGSAAEICAVGNDMTVNAGSLALPTTNIAQPACVGSNTCRWYSAAWGPGWVPTGSLPSCAAGQEGGKVALSTDHREYFCDGTLAQRVAFSLSGSASLDFPSLAANEKSSALTVTVTGAATTDRSVHCQAGASLGNNIQIFESWVSSANTVSVRVWNTDDIDAEDLAATTFYCTVTR